MENNMFELEEEKRLSIRDFFKVCIGITKKAKIRAGIIAGSVFIILTCLILFVLNPSQGEYVGSWTYDVYGLTDYEVQVIDKDSNVIETKNKIEYLDGTSFNVKDLYSLEGNLYRIIDSNASLKSIDAYQMYNKDGISIIVEEGTSTSPTKFTIHVNQKYFTSKDQAREFVKQIAYTPILNTQNMISSIDNTRYLKVYKSYSDSYEEKIAALTNQAELIMNSYEALMEKYGDRQITTLGVAYSRVSDLYHSAEASISTTNLDSLLLEVQKNHYVYNYDEYLPVLESKKSVLNEKLAIVTAKIDALKAEGVSNDTLSELLIEKEDLKNDIKILDELITDGATVDTSTFDLKLQIAYNRLNNLTTNLTNCQKEVLSSRQKIFYDNNSIIVESGSIGTILTLVLSLVVGVVVAAVVNLYFDYSKYKKELNDKKEEE